MSFPTLISSGKSYHTRERGVPGALARWSTHAHLTLTCVRNRRERSDLECRRHGPNTLHTAGGRGAPPLPGAKSLRSSKQNPLFPATDHHAPSFSHLNQPHGCRIFLRWRPKEDFVF